MVQRDKYGKLKDVLDEICNDKYPKVKDTLNCIKTTMFGVGLGGVLLRNIPSQGMTIETVKESFQKDIIGLVAFSTVVELIQRTSSKVLNTAENMLLKYIDNIDIYDIPDFRDLKILSNDIDLIISTDDPTMYNIDEEMIRTVNNRVVIKNVYFKNLSLLTIFFDKNSNYKPIDISISKFSV